MSLGRKRGAFRGKENGRKRVTIMDYTFKQFGRRVSCFGCPRRKEDCENTLFTSADTFEILCTRDKVPSTQALLAN